MVEPPTNWETKRLHLRPATVAEAADAFESYTANPQVSRYMTWRPHRTLAETEQFLRRCEDAWRQRTAFPWSLWLKSDGSFVGVLEARVKQHSVDNVASARLLESVGMQLEGTLQRWLIHPNMSEQPRDCLCYAAVKAI